MIPQEDFNSALKASYAEALAKQPLYKRRRASMTSLAAMVIQVSQVLVVFVSEAPMWVSALIGVLVYAAEVVVQAESKNGLGPYQTSQIIEAAEAAGVVDTSDRVNLLTRSTADIARELRQEG